MRRSVWRFVLFLAVAGSWPGLALAQAELSLGDLVARALQENYQIRVFRNLEVTAANRNTIGNAGYLPTVALSGEQRASIRNSRQEFFTGDSQQANNARSNSSSVDLDVNWIVFDGLAMFARKDQFEQLATLSQADTRFFMEQTVADLAIAYYQLRQETALLDALRETLAVSQERVRFEEQAVEIGASTLLDLQLARVDRNTDSSLVVNQEAQVREVVLAINRLINRDLTAPLTPTDSIVLDPTLSLTSLLESARANNAALNQQQLTELITTTEADIQKGALFPEVSLFGNYGFNRQSNEVGFLQSSRTFGPAYGIRVRFNLFSGHQRRIAYENAQIDIATEQLRTQDLQLEIEQLVRVAHLRWAAARDQLAVERASIEAADAALEIARRQYELGTITNIDFRVIQLNSVNARTRFLEAQLAAKQREIDLLRLSGRLLQEIR
jgi:outer membrane protein TolC